MKEFPLTRREFLRSTMGAAAFLMMKKANFPGLDEKGKKKVAFLYDDIYLKHDTGDYHPESPTRLLAINKKLKKADWYHDLLFIKARPINFDELLLVHEKRYIDLVKRECQIGYLNLSTGDTTISNKSYDVSRQAAGGVLKVVDAVMSGKTERGFCAVRPPGHHASQSRGMGFCLFNNIAIAARYLQTLYRLMRILIADWDVHLCNGTQDIFYDDETVFFMSSHQSPWYPGTGNIQETGEGKGKGFTMNRPFSAGAGNEEIISAFQNDLLPAARKFKPDFTLISAGFDSRFGDPLGGLTIDDDGFRQLYRF